MTAPTVSNPDTDAPVLPSGWRGRLMPINTPSGDGQGHTRMMALDGDVVPTRPLPVAFNAQETLDDGHDGSRVIGLITRVWLENNYVMGEGPFDLEDPIAAEWARKLGAGYAGWVSIDLSNVAVEEVPLDADGQPIPPDAFEQWERDMIAWESDPADVAPPPEPPQVADVLLRIVNWKVMGATLVSSPAFEDARVQPVYGEFDQTPAGAGLIAAADGAEEEHTGAMIALVPADPGQLAVDGGDPPEQMHMTLAYLGEAADWTPDAQAALTTALTGILGGQVEADVFGWATFNPDSTEHDACAVYLVNSPAAADMQAAVADVLETTLGVPKLPEQHPFLPHVTAGYGVDVGKLTFTGPVTFDRLRVAFGGENHDLMLDTEALAASAGVTYRHEDFFQPEPDEYVNSWRVDDQGRVSMHLAAWGECHIGFANRCVSPPAGVDDYRRFHRLPIDTDQGRLRVGKVTMSTGHASTDPSVTAAAAISHYDNTGTLVAVVRCSDGVHGPWLSGHLVPWATREQAGELSHHEVSGDWRGPLGRMELVAALAVNHPGFMKSVADDGREVLVAAGLPIKTPPVTRHPVKLEAAPVSADQLRGMVRGMLAEFATERARDEQVRPLDDRVRAARAAKLDRRVWV